MSCLIHLLIFRNRVHFGQNILYLLYQEKLSDWISELQERSENVEDLVSELELAYNSVEVKASSAQY